jgi:glutathione S-transferase
LISSTNRHCQSRNDCSRFVTDDFAIEPKVLASRNTMTAHPLMQEWMAAAKLEPDELEELDAEF